MKKYQFTLLFLISTFVSFSQTIEFGPSIQYHRTAFQKPDSGTIVITSSGSSGEGVKTTETDANIAFGGYFGYYTENTFVYLAELFYVATSSPNYGDNSFQSINLVPSVAAEVLRKPEDGASGGGARLGAGEALRLYRRFYRSSRKFPRGDRVLLDAVPVACCPGGGGAIADVY